MISTLDNCLLDLSFNNIKEIKNLEALVNLEDLSLFHNKIKKIEKLDTNKKLRYLALGGNELSSLENVRWIAPHSTFHS